MSRTIIKYTFCLFNPLKFYSEETFKDSLVIQTRHILDSTGQS